jgi:hypothetical protein
MKLNLKSRGLVLRLLKYPDKLEDMGFPNKWDDIDPARERELLSDIHKAIRNRNKKVSEERSADEISSMVNDYSNVPISFFVRFYDKVNLEQVTEQFKSLAEDISLSNNIDGTFIATTSAETYQNVFEARIEYVQTQENNETGYWNEFEPAKIPTEMEDKIEQLYSSFQFGINKK